MAKKYRAGNTRAQMRGALLLACRAVIHQEHVRSAWDEMLEEYSLSAVEPDEWYPLQAGLGLYRRVSEHASGSLANFVAIGISIAELTSPTYSATFQDTLCHLPGAFLPYLRPASPITYRVELTAQRAARLVDNTPFPHDLVFGHICGALNHYKTAGLLPRIERTYLNQLHPDEDGAIYEICW